MEDGRLVAEIGTFDEPAELVLGGERDDTTFSAVRASRRRATILESEGRLGLGRGLGEAPLDSFVGAGRDHDLKRNRNKNDAFSNGKLFESANITTINRAIDLSGSDLNLESQRVVDLSEEGANSVGN